MKASDCAAATMNSTSPDRVAAWTKLCAVGFQIELAEHDSADHHRIERGEGRDLGRGGKADS